MDMGVFIPIANNGWLISEGSPQYMASFDLNKQVVQKAESYGLEFALSMVKFRGFGGKTEFWDHALESFTLMAGLAAVTSEIKLFASTAILTLPPAIVARMASTISSIAPGRFGINIVTGWAEGEYSQMGLWPGNEWFGYRYDYATEYVQVMKDLWGQGSSDFKGEHFTMADCKLSPPPQGDVEIVAAGMSPRGMKFAAEYADYNFILGAGINTPTAFADNAKILVEAGKESGRDVGAYVLFMVIADETDEAAMAKWQKYHDMADMGALKWLIDQSNVDEGRDGTSTAKHMAVPEGAVNFNMGTLVGSYATVAKMLDEAAAVEGVKGIMMTFDDFLLGMDAFGENIQPLMQSRSHKLKAA
ncbi:pyrimidine utilization protein A [Alloyangia pacifica]|uniref:pyrimidine utilization protein A n=1 Tax=Alloyangia pacifica TaxID=311180 RepID=UPI001CFE5C9F|nr:pyrimidine utilization protein A [Alloyangia pacifica]